MNMTKTEVLLVQNKLVFQCPICGKLFRTSGAAGMHLTWCKCKHCRHWTPGYVTYRRCDLGHGSVVHDEGSHPPPNNCPDYRGK